MLSFFESDTIESGKNWMYVMNNIKANEISHYT